MAEHWPELAAPVHPDLARKEEDQEIIIDKLEKKKFLGAVTK